ncbi:MAG: universal stress protein [Ginsengibacter sp.]
MKNILVPIDFSPASRNAATYAVSLAQAFDATVYVFHAILPPVLIDDSILASVMVTQAEIVAENNKSLEHEVEKLSKEFSVTIKGLVREGYASNIIPELAAENDIDVIVMGMKGEGKSISIFGSTTTTIIRKSDYPVFVIPENAGYKPITNITLASDYDTEIEMDRYNVLLALAEKFTSKINIINIQKKSASLNREESVGKKQTSLAFSGYNHQFHTLNENSVAEGINQFIEINHTDILAMVAHKHPLFDRLFGKVHTKSMSYQTKLPLLVLQSK